MNIVSKKVRLSQHMLVAQKHTNDISHQKGVAYVSVFQQQWMFIMKKVASLHYGVIFKKAFSQPAIFTAFAQDFLGLQKGEQKRQLAIAKSMLKEGFEPDIIHKITNVPLATLQNLAK